MKSRKKLIVSLAVVFFLNALIIGLVQSSPSASAAIYKRGAQGAVVKQIQQKLKAAGLYNGNIDGIYGSGTENGVRAYQKTMVSRWMAL